ncbi:unnamed protein product [Cunninghamella echinulata]
MNQNSQQTQSILDSYESTENVLMDSFKAAALKVTTLYKDSLVQNRKAYASGYQQALQDLYEFISSHPSTTVSQGETLAPPMEQGYLPVEDLLTYARQRNAQLNSEMGLPLDPTQQSTSTSSVPNNNSTTFDPSYQSQALSQFSNNTSTIDPTSIATATNNNNNTATHNTNTNANNNSNNNNNHSNNNSNNMINPSSPVITVSSTGPAAVVKNAFHPFQIDPNTQFTFSLPVNYHPHAWYNNNINHHQHQHHHSSSMSNFENYHQMENNNNNNNNTSHMNNMNSNSGFMLNENTVDGLKRRMTPNEFTFMGRQLNSMNIDNWNEPPMKRRPKRDD